MLSAALSRFAQRASKRAALRNEKMGGNFSISLVSAELGSRPCFRSEKYISRPWHWTEKLQHSLLRSWPFQASSCRPDFPAPRTGWLNHELVVTYRLYRQIPSILTEMLVIPGMLYEHKSAISLMRNWFSTFYAGFFKVLSKASTRREVVYFLWARRSLIG